MKTISQEDWATIADLCIGMKAVRNLQEKSDEEKLGKMKMLHLSLGQTLESIEAMWNAEAEVAKRAR